MSIAFPGGSREVKASRNERGGEIRPSFTLSTVHSLAGRIQGHVWLEGDNKDNSTDSRSYGAVPQALVEGVVFVRLWPLRDVGLM